MKIETYTACNQGGRDYNEDSVRCFEKNGVCAVAVADGLGGHGGGQIASSKAADCIVNAFAQNPRLDSEHLRSLFERANAEVIAAQTATQKMKSTGVALFANGDSVMWAHVGDSRLYYFKDGALTAYTLDHSVSQMCVSTGEITRDQIRHHADRNRVLRAFGGDDIIKAEVSPVLALGDGSHAFLLCTDGFWEYVFENEMEAQLAKSKTPREWVESMNKLLAARVPNDNDNFSAAAVFLKKSRGGAGVNKAAIIAAALAAIAIIAAIAVFAFANRHDGGDSDERTSAVTTISDSENNGDTLPPVPGIDPGAFLKRGIRK